MGAVDIGYWQLGLTFVFILVAGGCSILLHLDLHRDLLWGSLRTAAQLFLMAYILRYIFHLATLWVGLLVFGLMIFFAANIAVGRAKSTRGAIFIPTIVSLLASSFLVTVFVTGIIVQVHPWYEPRYFIPLGGMIVGNAMNAVALSLERLLADLRRSRETVELYLSLGATYEEASQTMVRDSVKAGMLPSITSMMGVGIVFLPGMMTGQILAGADPLMAIKYQIVVMLMLTASTALAAIMVVLLVRRRLFSADHRLLLE